MGMAIKLVKCDVAGALESQGDSATKPRVARNELPWENASAAFSTLKGLRPAVRLAATPRTGSKSAGKPDALQTLRAKHRNGEQTRVSVWSAPSLLALFPAAASRVP